MTNQTPVAKRKHFLNIISLCCSNDVPSASKLLQDLTGEKAKNQKDLETKIAIAYRNSDDKIAIEKVLASMHPDKDFILKYNNTKLAPTDSVQNTESLNETSKEVAKITNQENISNYCGNPNCRCNCNRESYAIGNNEQNSTQQQTKSDHTQLIIAVFGITAIFGMALIIYKK
jgi:hypothetical protein